MNEVSWLGFGIASTVTKSYMHFLPAASGIGAPYPVELKVSVGGISLPRRTFSVEGARLGHPDGFRLEEAVPALNQHGSGLYLLQVDIAPVQQRIDLSSSCILVELQYQQGAVRYLPRRVCPQVSGAKVRRTKSENSTPTIGTLGSVMSRGIFNPDAENSCGFALRDPALYASIVVVNGSSEPIVARVFSSRSSESVGSLSVGPDSLKECEIGDLGLNHPSKLDSTWGSVEVEAFKISFETYVNSANESENPEVLEGHSTQQISASNLADTLSTTRTEPILGAATAAYVVYRDRSSRRISSVVAI